MDTSQNIKLLTDEELEKYKQSILKRREYKREYMRKKREADPEYVKKSNEIRNAKKKEKYKNDPEYQQKEKEYAKNYSKIQREKMNLAKEQYKLLYGINI